MKILSCSILEPKIGERTTKSRALRMSLGSGLNIWEDSRRSPWCFSLLQFRSRWFPALFISCRTPSRWGARASLDMMFTVDEVWTIEFDMRLDKSPGPNGYHYAFFQKTWSTVDGQVLVVFLIILNDTIQMELNRTTITLISKVKNPRKMSDFRPISFCNVLYKDIG